jgi:hypothetical protein
MVGGGAPLSTAHCPPRGRGAFGDGADGAPRRAERARHEWRGAAEPVAPRSARPLR